jgi:hypothetical protein
MAPKRWIANKKWEACPKKKLAREETIIKLYRKWSGKESLPGDLQYWSLCGPCGDENGLIPGREFDHIISSGLIRPSQWYGVERLPESAANNMLLKDIVGGNWFQGNIIDVMDRQPILRPGFINLDTNSMFEQAMREAGDIMCMLSMSDHPILMTVNVVRGVERYGRSPISMQEVVKNIKSRCVLAMLRSEKWNILGNPGQFDFFQYPGTGRSSTTMMSIFFERKPKIMTII